jgi:recombination protein RecA
MEDGFSAMFVGIVAGFDIIGIDSVAAMVPKAELEKKFEDPAKIGAVAAKFSRELPKFVGWLNKYPLLPGDKNDKNRKSDPSHPGTALVLVNQTRAVINTGYSPGHGGNEDNTSGGKALKFYAYERLRMTRIKSESVERKDAVTGQKKKFPYGNLTDVKVVKSKIDAKQGHSTQVFIRYGTGIDDYFSIIETGVTQRLIRKDGSFYTLGDQKYKGRDALRKHLMENPTAYESLRSKIVQAVNAGAVLVEEPDEEEVMEGFDLGGDDEEAVEAAAEEIVSDGAAE